MLESCVNISVTKSPRLGSQKFRQRQHELGPQSRALPTMYRNRYWSWQDADTCGPYKKLKIVLNKSFMSMLFRIAYSSINLNDMISICEPGARVICPLPLHVLVTFGAGHQVTTYFDYFLCLYSSSLPCSLSSTSM